MGSGAALPSALPPALPNALAIAIVSSASASDTGEATPANSSPNARVGRCASAPSRRQVHSGSP